jgi:hypothetical protein
MFHLLGKITAIILELVDMTKEKPLRNWVLILVMVSQFEVTLSIPNNGISC